MSESKHTPGPWFSHGRYIGTKNHKSAIGECRDINGNWSDDAQSSGNARLIAAAPEMLEALDIVVGCLLWNKQDEASIEVMRRVNAVRAKAEGRS